MIAAPSLPPSPLSEQPRSRSRHSMVIGTFLAGDCDDDQIYLAQVQLDDKELATVQSFPTLLVVRNSPDHDSFHSRVQKLQKGCRFYQTKM